MNTIEVRLAGRKSLSPLTSPLIGDGRRLAIPQIAGEQLPLFHLSHLLNVAQNTFVSALTYIEVCDFCRSSCYSVGIFNNKQQWKPMGS